MAGALSLSPLAPPAGATRRSRVVVAPAPAAPSPQGAAGANQSGAAVAGNLLSGALASVDARRASLGVDVGALCSAAAVSERSYRWWRAERRAPSRPVVQRLHSALDRLAAGADADAGGAALIEATLGGFRVAALAALPPGVEGQGSRVALAEHVALYCANQFVGLRQARLAAHRGLSRPAVHLAIRRVEALRDADRAVDAAIVELGRTIARQED